MRDFRDLKVWQRSHSLTREIYRHTATFPREEIYGLTSQIRRASSSVPSNIAEGTGSDSDAEFKRYLTIAFASASELDYLLILTRDLGFITPDSYQVLHQELSQIKRMLNTFIQRLKANR